MSGLLVGEVLVVVLAVGGFGYFIYKKVTAKKETSGTGTGGGGGGSKGGGSVNQV
jgi:hypothetical protein